MFLTKNMHLYICTINVTHSDLNVEELGGVQSGYSVVHGLYPSQLYCYSSVQL
jgi:hypothetical protein